MKLSNLRLAIGVPLSFPTVPSAFLRSFLLMEKPDYIYIQPENGPIDTLRNDIVEKALSEGASHVIMCDADQIYPVDTITKLLAHNLPVVAAKVPRRYPPFDPIILRLTASGYMPLGIGDYEKNSLVECDAVGTGCILYHADIFKKIPYPWFEFKKHPDTGLVIGEDIGMCQKIKKLGYKIHVDTSIDVGHLATMIVTEATHKLWCAMQISKEKKAAALGVME